MKISKIFLPFQQMLEAVSTYFNIKNNGTSSSPVLIPVRVKESDRFAMMRSREAQRRYNQGNNIL